MSDMARVIFSNYVSEIYCIAPSVGAEASLEDYKAAFALSETLDIAAVVCASEDEEVLLALKESVERASQSGRERIAFGGAGQVANQNTVGAKALAQALDSERFCLAAPRVNYNGQESSVWLAAAYAALVTASDDPSANLNSSVISGEFVFPEAFTEENIDSLIEGGVAVFENLSGNTELIRAITTRQPQGGAAFHELSSVRITDDVISSVRAMLKDRLRGLKNSESARESIKSQVTIELENKKKQNIISAYDAPVVYPKENEPTVCVVEIGFTLMYAVHQIHLTAFVEV